MKVKPDDVDILENLEIFSCDEIHIYFVFSSENPFHKEAKER